MYKNYILGIVLSFLFLINQNAFAQVEPCATNTKHQEMLASDENYKATYEKMQADLQRHIAKKMSNASTERTEAVVYNIPVVVHVIHTGGAEGTIYNPSVANINAMLGKINTDFRNTTFGADVEINFVLAQRDPNCNTTTGINRVNGSGLPNYTANGVGTGGAADADVKALSIWSNTDYYNIWIVNKINGNDGTSGSFVAGYAYFPGAPANIDGTVILATQTNGTSTTMTHEFGHAFALQHTFHKAETGNDSANAADCPLNTDCTIQGDLICDTDPHGYMLGACAGTNCGGVDAATLDNYMSYCSGTSRFTPNQVTRMRTALETQRGGLISSLGGTAPSGTLPTTPVCVTTAPESFSALGVGRVRFNTLDVASGGSEAEGAYVDRTCSQSTTVNAGDTYTLIVNGVFTNSHRIRAYIDYNNNGDFTDVGEEVLISNSGSGDHIASVTIPLTATIGISLRLRVVADFSGGTGTINSCLAGQYGQGEDYSVTIQSTASACSITTINTGIQTACVLATNNYTQEVTVTYSNPPASGNLIVNGQSFAITSSPQTVTLTGLISDGNSVDVVASFSADAGCTFTETNAFTAPTSCTPICSITAISAGTQTGCVSTTNTYTQEVTVTYSNPPASGNLVVNGQSFAITSSPQTVILTGLIADGNSVDAVASFSANAGCTFTETNAFTAPASCIPAATANTLDFDGLNDYINTPVTADANTGTIEYWFYTDNLNSAQIPFYFTNGVANHDGYGDIGNFLEVNTGTENNELRFFYQNGNNGSSSIVLQPVVNLCANTWYHYAATYDRNGFARLYLNGALVAEEDMSAKTFQNHTPTTQHIGKPIANSRYTKGLLDELRIWNTVRTCEQIQSNMSNELIGNEAGLITYYNFNQGIASGNNTTITSLNDVTAANNDGTLNNFSLTGAASNWLASANGITGTTPVTPAEIALLGNATFINDGDATPDVSDDTDFGSVVTSDTHTFTVRNTGGAKLFINSIEVTGANASDFVITDFTCTKKMIDGGSSITFNVVFTPSAVGIRNATITIKSSDCDLEDFDFAVQGNKASSGDVLLVETGIFYPTIQEAVDVAVTGNTIKPTGNRNYPENVIVDKNLTFTSDFTDYKNVNINQILVENGNKLTITGDMSIVEVLHLESTGEMEVTGSTTDFALLSSATQTALVINDSPTNTVVGTVIMERYLPAVSDLGGTDGRGYHLFSSPFSDATVSQFGDDMSLVLTTAYNTAPEPAFVRPFPTFFQYEESNAGATSSAYFNPFISNYKVPTTANLTVTRGYQANISTGVTVDLNGTLNNGSQSISVTNSGGGFSQEGYNLVGNPYPSPIDWELVLLASTGVEDAVYIDIPVNQYQGIFAEYVNGVSNNGGKKEIASMQGFFVRTLGGGTVNMNNGVRLSTDTRFYKTTETENLKEGLIRIALKKGNSLDETTIYFESGATPNFDGKYDAAKLHKMNSASPTLYSYNENTETAETEYFAINGLGRFDSDQSLPLAMNILTDGEYEITLRSMKYFHSKHELYLYDSLTDSLHNLKAEGDYKFEATKGNEVKRFVLLFKTEASQDFFENEKLMVYPNPTPNRFSYSLRTNKEGNYTIRLFDATGRIIFEESKIKEGAFLEGTIDLEKQASGLYLLQVSDSEITTTVRIVKE
ncbi:LamG-like jellyroll fold domain-containing protein [Bernardetia sp. MNP-M8]|uniref:LamG-like jellyroll fold domain-containing protein n=1 Tax=Bernardetia sp. MNP-M8 TaxID=3127470 RepID=UPI0030CD31BA